NDSFNRFYVASASPSLFRTYTVNAFNDSELAHTLYANASESVYINIHKNITLDYAFIDVKKVDLGIVNYDPNYNIYTMSMRNGTDEILIAGMRGYVALLNKTDGSIIAAIDSGTTSYIRDSSFKPDGTEASLVTEDGKLLLYNAVSRTMTSKTASPYYLTSVAYSPDGSYAVGGGDWNGPLFHYNSNTGIVSNLSNQCGGNCWIEIVVDIKPDGTEALFAGYKSTYSKGITKYNLSCGLSSLNTNNWATCGTLISSISTTWRDVKYNPNGTEALVVGDGGNAVLYNSSDDSITVLTTGTTKSLRGVSYTPDGTQAIITGLGGIALVFNSSCNPVLCNLSTGKNVNLNDIEFDNNSNAIMVGSGRIALRYNATDNALTTLRDGTSGILYHIAAKPNSDMALIVGDEGQVFKYNFTTKAMTTLDSGVTFTFNSVFFNWNGSEALIVGDSGTVLRYNSTDSSFTNLTTSTTVSLLDVSYRNGTNEALISGNNKKLLFYNLSSISDISGNLPGSFPTGFPILAVSYSPDGSIALMGAWGRMMKYQSSDGTITMVEREGAGTGVAMWPHKIAWNPDGTEALIAGDSGGAKWNLGCSSGMIGAVALYNTSKGKIDDTYCFGYNYLEDVAFSPDGTEALIVGREGDLGKYNSSGGSLSNSITKLSSGTSGALFGVDYRRDGVANEALLVVGDNKQVLFYDGERVLTDPEVWLDDRKIWNYTGDFNGSDTINITQNLTDYLDGCSEKPGGTCDVPFLVNSSGGTALMRLENINISYQYNSSITSSDTIYEYSWNETTHEWNISTLGEQSLGFYAVAVGKGRNDTTYRVYGANTDGHGYEYTWNSTAGNWSVLDMDGVAGYELYDVYIGDGRNDSTTRVYFTSIKGYGYEYTWNATNSNFTIATLGRLGKKTYAITSGDGQNTDQNKIYSSDRSYQISEATYNAGSWSLVRVGATTNRGYYSDDVKLIDTKNDDVMRVYSTRTDGSLYVNEYYKTIDDEVGAPASFMSGEYSINFSWKSSDSLTQLAGIVSCSKKGENEILIETDLDLLNTTICEDTDGDHSTFNDCNILWNTTTADDGTNYFILLRMDDGIQTVQTSTEEFIIDNSPPYLVSVDINPNDKSGYIPNDTYAFTVDYADRYSGISLVTFNFNGTNYSTSKMNNKYYANISNLFIGDYDYHLTGVDGAGNVNKTSNYSYRVNIIYSVSPEKEKVKTFNGLSVDFDQLSYDPNNLTYEWLLDRETISSNQTWTYSSVLYDIGEHSVTTNVYDNDIPFNDTHSWTVDVWLRGDTDHDVEGDYDVDIWDLAKIGLCYGCSSDKGCWLDCENADVDLDNKVHLLDLATVGYYYGTEYEKQKIVSLAAEDENITQYIYQYNYSLASANITYDNHGNTFTGKLIGHNLKPNFSYQMKLEGKPACIYGDDGDNVSNEKIGYIGRWWDHDYCTTTCNIGDEWVEEHPDHCITGYILFDHFTTDGNGNIEKNFSIDSSYHVLWCSAPEGGNNNNYLAGGYCPANNLWAEPQSSNPTRPPPGEVNMSNGNYSLRFLLTEESFHNASTGQWPTVMSADNIIFDIGVN
ncbi:MAG: hypothetical protein KAU20_07485, partial [Nanoarchaeota archaeon]|nr:hypothetical protein [Nanoarchaeota archaeon]